MCPTYAFAVMAKHMSPRRACWKTPVLRAIQRECRMLQRRASLMYTLLLCWPTPGASRVGCEDVWRRTVAVQASSRRAGCEWGACVK